MFLLWEVTLVEILSNWIAIYSIENYEAYLAILKNVLIYFMRNSKREVFYI